MVTHTDFLFFCFSGYGSKLFNDIILFFFIKRQYGSSFKISIR